MSGRQPHPRRDEICGLARQGYYPAQIARSLALPYHVVYHALRQAGLIVRDGRRMHRQRKRAAAMLDGGMLPRDEPGLAGEPPLRDDLARCDAQWAALLGGRRTLAYTRRSAPR